MTEMRPDDIRIGQVVRASRIEYDDCPARFTQFAERKIHDAISHFIQAERSNLVVTDSHAEMRMELYVATPDQFWALIQQEAERIALRYARR